MEDKRFEKGHTPWNKGMKGFVHKGSFKEGHAQSNTGKTHFKKGHIPWSKLNPELMPEPWNKGMKDVQSSEAKGRETILSQKKIKNINLDFTKLQASYLAAFLDADGNIGIGGSESQSWALSITFYNSNKKALETMREWIGFGRVIERVKRNPKWRTNYHLKYSSARAAKILERLYPYLLVKKDQAGVSFEFVDTFKRGNYYGGDWKRRGRRVKADTLKKREELKKKLQSLTGTANYLGKNNNKKKINL